MNNGKVYLVGAGPGDEGLITKKGFDLLLICDVVIYDRLVNKKLLTYCKSGCEKVDVGKIVGSHEFSQDEINKIIIEKAKENKFVVRLKGGDPFVFGRGGEEIIALKEHNLNYEVVSGVTSAISGLANVGIPITHRGVSRGFHIVTGFSADKHSAPKNLDVLAKLDETLVFLMGFSNLKEIVKGLLENGKKETTPVAIISNATTEKQKELRATLGTILVEVEKSDINAPALIVVGDVANLDLRDNDNVLSNVKIGVTGTKEIIKKQKEKLELLGAKVFDASIYSVMDVDKDNELITEFENIKKYNWLVFTSTNAVKYTFDKIIKNKIDLRNLANIKFAVVGKGTKETLNKFGFNADFMPEKSTSYGLASELIVQIKDNEKLLIPRAKNHTDELVNVFVENKIDFKEVIIYDVIKEYEERLDNLDFLTFSSGKAVQDFNFENVNANVVCIGEVTEKELIKKGVITSRAEECTVDGLVDMICTLKGSLYETNEKIKNK